MRGDGAAEEEALGEDSAVEDEVGVLQEGEEAGPPEGDAAGPLEGEEAGPPGGDAAGLLQGGGVTGALEGGDVVGALEGVVGEFGEGQALKN